MSTESDWQQAVAEEVDRLLNEQALPRWRNMVRIWAAGRLCELAKLKKWKQAVERHVAALEQHPKWLENPGGQPPQEGWEWGTYFVWERMDGGQGPRLKGYEGWGPPRLQLSRAPGQERLPAEGEETKIHDLYALLAALHDRCLTRFQKIAPWGWVPDQTGIRGILLEGEPARPDGDDEDALAALDYWFLVNKFADPAAPPLPEADLRSYLCRVEADLKSASPG